MSVRPAALAALLFAVLAVAFAGCGGDDEAASSTPAATGTATQDADAGSDQGEAGESGEEREREEEEAREAGGKDCATLGDLDGEPAKQPPEDVVVLLGAHVYESEGPFGKTERFLAAADGTPADLAARRDEAARQLEGVGFKTLSTDQEENAEAEAHMQGDRHTVDIQVIPLCEGKLRIRYTVS
jgi:hypothetical protein